MFRERMKYLLLLFTLTLTLSGCSLFFIGDGLLVVEGELSGYGDQQCDKYNKRPPYRTRQINGKFGTSFTVAGLKHEYILSVVCNGVQVAERSVIYPNDLNENGIFHMGIYVNLQ